MSRVLSGEEACGGGSKNGPEGLGSKVARLPKVSPCCHPGSSQRPCGAGGAFPSLCTHEAVLGAARPQGLGRDPVSGGEEA